MQHLRYNGYIMALIGATLWGVSGTVAQKLFQNDGFQPGWLVTVRMIITGILLLLFAGIKNNRQYKIWSILNDSDGRVSILIFGIVGMLGVQYAYFMSIKSGNAATATLLQYLAPMFIVAYLAIRFRKIPSLYENSAVCLAVMGTFLLVTNGTLQRLTISLSAVAWGVVSAIALAFYTLYPKTLLEKWGAVIVVGWGMIIGGIGLSLINPPWQIYGQNWSLISGAYVVFVVIFGTLIPFYLYIDSLRYIAPTEASLLGSAEPLSATIVSVFWLHVPLGVFEVIGGLCIICTVVILALRSEKRSEISIGKKVRL